MNEKDDKLREHLIKIYKRHDFELRANKDKVVEATMTEISSMINKMMDDLYEKIKKTRI